MNICMHIKSLETTAFTIGGINSLFRMDEFSTFTIFVVAADVISVTRHITRAIFRQLVFVQRRLRFICFCFFDRRCRAAGSLVFHLGWN